MSEALDSVIAQIRMLPNPDVEVDQLTDRDKIALCIAAGCEMKYVQEMRNGTPYLTATTANIVGIAKIDDRFQVFERKETDEPLMTVPLLNVIAGDAT